jgi:hypothetical protein
MELQMANKDKYHCILSYMPKRHGVAIGTKRREMKSELHVKVQVNLFSKNYVMKTCGSGDTATQFLTSVLYERERLASRSGRLAVRKTVNRTGGWVGFVCVNAEESRKISCP